METLSLRNKAIIRSDGAPHAGAYLVAIPNPDLKLSIESDVSLYSVNNIPDLKLSMFLEPHVRFVDTNHEQWVLFCFSPSGHAIELKSFTRTNIGQWA